MDTIGTRLGTTLRRAGISPRSLSVVSKVHFTTIYSLIRQKGKTYPVVEQALNDALDKIERLQAEGKLPIREDISDKEKTDRLVSLLATTD